MAAALIHGISWSRDYHYNAKNRFVCKCMAVLRTSEARPRLIPKDRLFDDNGLGDGGPGANGRRPLPFLRHRYTVTHSSAAVWVVVGVLSRFRNELSQLVTLLAADFL